MNKKIILIRHAKPIIDYYSKCNFRQCRKIIFDYNSSPNLSFDIDNLTMNWLTSLNCSVFSSDMTRTKLTASFLFKEKNIKVDKVFREFDLDVLNIPLVKIRFNNWLAVSRIFWFCNLIKNTRMPKDEIKRAAEATSILINHQKQEDNVVLVGHGMINHYISKNLKKEGWKLHKKIGKGYLGIKIYEK